MENKKFLELLQENKLPDPFKFLGAHPKGEKTCFRTFLPGAESVTVILKSNLQIELKRYNNSDLFFALSTHKHDYKPYKLRVKFENEGQSTFYDSFSFQPVTSEYDLFLWSQGNNYQIYNHLGAQLTVHQGISGVSFSVWAPSAQKIALVGDFNFWDGRRLNLRSRGSSGVWEIFVPHVTATALYKFEIIDAKGDLIIKTDPFAFFMEQRPQTASVVWDMNSFKWTDELWLENRKKKDVLSEPMAVYEIHLASWRKKNGWQWLTYRQAATELVCYLKEMGFNWVEFLPLAEHPFDASWGYQVGGYYAATSRFGTPDDLMFLIDSLHNNDIGVIIDWVPAHFPKDSYALAFFDGTHLYEHSDPKQQEQKDWGTLIFNYGRNEVKNFLVANALFWLDKYHIDALRVDAVASMIYLDYSKKEGEWIANKYGGRENLEALEFIKTLNTKIYELFPGTLTIAEESTAWPMVSRPVHLGGLGFMLKWNMGWMHDMLEFMKEDPIHRRYYMNRLTFALLYAFNENFCLPLSHDEVVHGKGSLWDKMPGDYWQKCANLKLLFGYMYGEPGKKLIFMGGEFGQTTEWEHDYSLNWDLLNNPLHQGIANCVKDLNHLYKNEPALYENDFNHDGFEWIDFKDAESTVVSFIRRGKEEKDELIFIFNFTPIVRHNYTIGINESHCIYQELFNSDSKYYGGSNIGLAGEISSNNNPAHGKKASLTLTLPPLAFLVLKKQI